jgi:hypothetical protein
MSSDYNEDRAHEMGFVPEEEDIMTEKEFAQFLRDRRPPLTADEIVGRSQNIYQGPDDAERIRAHFRPDVHVPWWAIVLFFAVFVGGVGLLLWMLS